MNDKDLGVIESKLSNGMFKTSTGDIIPAFPNVKIGDKVTIKNKNYDFGVKKTSSIEPATQDKARIEAMEEQIKNLQDMVNSQTSETQRR